MAKLQRLLRDRSGSAVIEFGILAPVLFGLMMFVFQIGMGMQNYNALRSIAADTARYAATNYQALNSLDAAAIQTRGQAIATAAPYSLTTADLSLTVTAVATPRITGIHEFTITIQYFVPSVLDVIGFHQQIHLTYTRPIFTV